jgi:CRP-like cAMP-binding protein
MLNTELQEQAQQALLEGNYVQARDLYAHMHQQDPDNIRTFLKLAEMKAKSGDIKGAIADYTTMADRYADNGFVVQAIAINKVIHRLDPEQQEVKERLARLHLERGEDWALSTGPVTLPPSDTLQSSNLTPVDRLKLGFTRTPLLSDLSDIELSMFIDSLTLLELKTGDIIYQPGEMGDFLYIIAMGSIQLHTTLVGGQKKIYARLGESAFFGEHAFMSRTKHNNIAVAACDTTLLVIKRDVFEQWASSHPKINGVVERFYRERVLKRVLALTPLFEGLADEIALELASKFTLQRYYDGETIVSEGEEGDTFCLIRSGSVVVSVKQKDNANKTMVLGRRGEGAFFGEIALLGNTTRTATVVAENTVEIMALSHRDFNAICARYPSVKEIVERYRDQRLQDTIRALVIQKKQ